MQRSGYLVLGLLPLCGPAPPAAAAALVYAAPCPAPAGRPSRIAISDTPKGPLVRYERAGTAPLETPDANFAHLSRRLFFTIKTPAGLIEFQGHAGPQALTGVLSDDDGTSRSITMPLAGSPASVRCEHGETR